MLYLKKKILKSVKHFLYNFIEEKTVIKHVSYELMILKFRVKNKKDKISNVLWSNLINYIYYKRNKHKSGGQSFY